MENELRSPKTKIDHKRQTFWQITFPILMVGLIFLAGNILIIISSFNGSTFSSAKWANLSSVYLLIPTIILTFILLLLISAIAYGIFWLIKNIPVWSETILYYFKLVQKYVKTYSDKVAEPILKSHETGAMVQTFFKRLLFRS